MFARRRDDATGKKKVCSREGAKARRRRSCSRGGAEGTERDRPRIAALHSRQVGMRIVAVERQASRRCVVARSFFFSAPPRLRVNPLRAFASLLEPMFFARTAGEGTEKKKVLFTRRREGAKKEGGGLFAQGR